MAASATVLKLGTVQETDKQVLATRFDLNHEDRELLEWLRSVALDVQLQGRIDVERACELIAVCPGGAPHRYASALLSATMTYTKTDAPLYRKGTDNVSRIEAWLVRLLGCFRSGDRLGVEMLVRSTIRPGGQRLVRFLAQGLSEVI